MSNRVRRFRPRVEALEGRLVPATIAVTTFADVVNPVDGKVSLREAISLANATAAPDTVILKAGVYRIGLNGGGEDANATGDFDVASPLTVVGQGAASTVLDGGRRDRLFDVLGTHTVGLSRLTLRNGGGPLDGGAVHAKTGNLILDRCLVSDSRALNGGGIMTSTGNVTLLGCTVSRNVASGGGGGVYVGSGTLTMRGSVVRRNRSGSDDGGGIFAGKAFLTGSVVAANFTLDDSGGILALSLTLTNSLVTGNVARLYGGGIRAGTATVIGSTVSGNSGLLGGGIIADAVTVTGSTVSGNSADTDGGGIRAIKATLTNSTLSGNSANNQGGGLYAATGAMLNCTVTENTAQEGGGVYHVGSDLFSVKNTIIAQNHVGFSGSGADVHGAFASQGHNLIGDPTGSTGFTGAGDQVGTSDDPLDARLGPLAFNGGPTMTHALLAGSRAIDRGDNAGVPAADQRGRPRRRDGDGNRVAVVDIGAFER